MHPVTTRGSPQCGSTPLALAAYRGHADVVDWLLARNANPCHTNRIGRSIIGYAISGNHLDVVKALLRASASLDVKDTVRCCFSLSLSLSCGLVLYGPIHSLDLLSWIEKQKRPVAAWVRDH